jgi:hypothetical protein
VIFWANTCGVAAGWYESRRWRWANIFPRSVSVGSTWKMGIFDVVFTLKVTFEP